MIIKAYLSSGEENLDFTAYNYILLVFKNMIVQHRGLTSISRSNLRLGDCNLEWAKPYHSGSAADFTF